MVATYLRLGLGAGLVGLAPPLLLRILIAQTRSRWSGCWCSCDALIVCCGTINPFLHCRLRHKWCFLGLSTACISFTRIFLSSSSHILYFFTISTNSKFLRNFLGFSVFASEREGGNFLKGGLCLIFGFVVWSLVIALLLFVFVGRVFVVLHFCL